MKGIMILLVAMMFGCGGSLSDEQRREMRGKMELNKIVRVTEVEIMEAAFETGRGIVDTLDRLRSDSAKLNAFLKTNGSRIRYIEPGASTARALEQQLVEAYLADESGSLQDNVQKLRNSGGDFDSLLYTKPVIKKFTDGTEQLEGVWNIWLPKSEIVLRISQERK